jgi:hypothetical protein
LALNQHYSFREKLKLRHFNSDEVALIPVCTRLCSSKILHHLSYPTLVPLSFLRNECPHSFTTSGIDPRCFGRGSFSSKTHARFPKKFLSADLHACLPTFLSPVPRPPSPIPSLRLFLLFGQPNPSQPVISGHPDCLPVKITDQQPPIFLNRSAENTKRGTLIPHTHLLLSRKNLFAGTYSFLFGPQERNPFRPPIPSQSKIINLQSSIPLKRWYTTRRAPTGADVSGNCFDRYRSMPDGNQVGLFCCRTRRFRKEAPAASWQWEYPVGSLRGAGGRSRQNSLHFLSLRAAVLGRRGNLLGRGDCSVVRLPFTQVRIAPCKDIQAI